MTNVCQITVFPLLITYKCIVCSVCSKIVIEHCLFVTDDVHLHLFVAIWMGYVSSVMCALNRRQYPIYCKIAWDIVTPCAQLHFRYPFEKKNVHFTTIVWCDLEFWMWVVSVYDFPTIFIYIEKMYALSAVCTSHVLTLSRRRRRRRRTMRDTIEYSDTNRKVVIFTLNTYCTLCIPFVIFLHFEVNKCVCVFFFLF